MKYLMIDDGLNEIPIIFPDIIEHFKMKPLRGEVVAGGEVQIYIKDGIITANCFGESRSCGVKSREFDSEIIQKALNKY